MKTTLIFKTKNFRLSKVTYPNTKKKSWYKIKIDGWWLWSCGIPKSEFNAVFGQPCDEDNVWRFYNRDEALNLFHFALIKWG